MRRFRSKARERAPQRQRRRHEWSSACPRRDVSTTVTCRRLRSFPRYDASCLQRERCTACSSTTTRHRCQAILLPDRKLGSYRWDGRTALSRAGSFATTGWRSPFRGVRRSTVGRAADPKPGGKVSSRREIVRRGSIAAAALAAGGGIGLLRRPAVAVAAAPSPAQDREIFNFALLLEYLQAAFYTEAVEQGALRGEVRRFAEVVSGHERAHVAYLRMALGRPRTPAPDVRLRRRPGRKPQSPDALRRTRRRSPGEQDSTCRASVSWCQAPTGSVLGVRLAARPDARSRCFRNGTAGERGRLERC
jgi:hypothetical protein